MLQHYDFIESLKPMRKEIYQKERYQGFYLAYIHKQVFSHVLANKHRQVSQGSCGEA